MESLQTLANLASLSALNYLKSDLSDSLNNELYIIESKLDLLLNQNQNNLQLNFVELSLAPAYTANSPIGWQTEPTNLNTIYDNDPSTASNLFQIAGYPWNWGEVVMTSGIIIPERTQVNMKLGLQQINGTRGIWELAVFKLSINDWVNVWSYNDVAPNSSDLIVNISVPIFFQWDKLRLKLWDVGIAATRCRIYDLKVFELKIS